MIGRVTILRESTLVTAFESYVDAYPSSSLESPMAYDLTDVCDCKVGFVKDALARKMSVRVDVGEVWGFVREVKSIKTHGAVMTVNGIGSPLYTKGDTLEILQSEVNVTSFSLPPNGGNYTGGILEMECEYISSDEVDTLWFAWEPGQIRPFILDSSGLAGPHTTESRAYGGSFKQGTATFNTSDVVLSMGTFIVPPMLSRKLAERPHFAALGFWVPTFTGGLRFNLRSTFTGTETSFFENDQPFGRIYLTGQLTHLALTVTPSQTVQNIPFDWFYRFDYVAFYPDTVMRPAEHAYQYPNGSSVIKRVNEQLYVYWRGQPTRMEGDIKLGPFEATTIYPLGPNGLSAFTPRTPFNYKITTQRAWVKEIGELL